MTCFGQLLYARQPLQLWQFYRVSSASLFALLINPFWKTSPNKLRVKTTTCTISKLVLTNVTSRCILDVTDYLDTALKLATIKSLNMNNYVNVNNNKKVVKQIFWGHFSRSHFYWMRLFLGTTSLALIFLRAIFRGVNFQETIFCEQLFRGCRCQWHFSGHSSSIVSSIKYRLPYQRIDNI